MSGEQIVGAGQEQESREEMAVVSRRERMEAGQGQGSGCVQH